MDLGQLGRQVGDARRRRGLTQRQLAEQAGISVSFLAHIETGGRMPALDTAARLSEALNMPLGELAQCQTGDREARAELLEIAEHITRIARRL